MVHIETPKVEVLRANQKNAKVYGLGIWLLYRILLSQRFEYWKSHSDADQQGLGFRMKLMMTRMMISITPML